MVWFWIFYMRFYSLSSRTFCYALPWNLVWLISSKSKLKYGATFGATVWRIFELLDKKFYPELTLYLSIVISPGRISNVNAVLQVWAHHCTYLVLRNTDFFVISDKKFLFWYIVDAQSADQSQKIPSYSSHQ